MLLNIFLTLGHHVRTFPSLSILLNSPCFSPLCSFALFSPTQLQGHSAQLQRVLYSQWRGKESGSGEKQWSIKIQTILQLSFTSKSLDYLQINVFDFLVISCNLFNGLLAQLSQETCLPSLGEFLPRESIKERFTIQGSCGF